MAWLTGWGFRKEVPLPTPDSDLADVPCRVSLSVDDDFHEARADGFDIRFTTDDGETLCKYEREYWTGGNGNPATAEFWVKAPSVLSAGGNKLYIYYGKTDAVDGQDVNNTWDNNFKGVWHLKESSGAAIASKGNVNGIYQGDLPDPVDVAVYKGQDLDGTGDYIDINPYPLATRHGSNPLIVPGAGGSFDDEGVYDSSVLIVGNEVWIYYSANAGNQIITEGLAISEDGGITFTKYGKVLDVGASGTWDDLKAHDVSVIKDGDTYKMWYSGTRNPEATYGLKIGYVTSSDGKNWTKYENNPVFDKGNNGQWDEAHVVYPSVFKEGDTYYMFYSGYNGTNYTGIGLAISTDGIIWVRDDNNPVIPGNFIFQGDIRKINDTYWMLYREGSLGLAIIKLAYSTDKINWTTIGNVLSEGDAGQWDDYEVICPGWLNDNDFYYTGRQDGGALQVGLATNVPFQTVEDQFNLLPITVECWINTDIEKNHAGLLVKYASASYNGWTLNSHTDGLYGMYYKSSGNFVSSSADKYNIDASTLYHVVMTVDSTNLKLYVNGDLQKTKTWTGTQGVTTTTNHVQIGKYTDNDFDGKIDEARISNIARSDAWIKFEYANMNIPPILGAEEGVFVYAGDIPLNLIPDFPKGIMDMVYGGDVSLAILPETLRALLEKSYLGDIPLALLPNSQYLWFIPYAGDNLSAYLEKKIDVVGYLENKVELTGELRS